MDLYNIERLSPLNGRTLSVEETCGLEVAMLQRKLAENLAGKFVTNLIHFVCRIVLNLTFNNSGKMYFWGKIFGIKQDYIVVYNVDPYGYFPDKKYYYW
jgi:hypothetical protein